MAGLNEADYLYSLGVAPVGVHEWFGEYPYATGPWADPVRAELGAEPEVLEGFDVNVEWVASLDPDLIVVAYHDIDQTIYDQLSEIAPVVAAPTGPGVDVWAAPWRVQYRLIADAVGERDRAEAVIADVDATIERIKAEHPLFAGATFDTGGLDDGEHLDVLQRRPGQPAARRAGHERARGVRRHRRRRLRPDRRRALRPARPARHVHLARRHR